MLQGVAEPPANTAWEVMFFHKCQGVQRHWVSRVVIPKRKAVGVLAGFTLWSLAVGTGFYEYILKLPLSVACLWKLFLLI